MEKKIIVAIKEPDKDLEVKEIENTLENFQSAVGGLIESIYLNENLDKQNVSAFGNDEAKILLQEPNFWIYDKQHCICGSVVFVKGDDEGGCISLTEEDIEAIKVFLQENEMNEYDKVVVRKAIKEMF